MKDVELFDIANKMCAEQGHTIIYLTHFGSRLYGTSSENSDTDVKGIFIPNKVDMLVGNHCKQLNWITGTCKGKNTKYDIDMQLWSLQYWIHLISIGDTNALDLLFSITNSECVIYAHPPMCGIFGKAIALFDPSKLYGYLGYILGQAKKYGLKGSRLGVIKNVKEWLDNWNAHHADDEERPNFKLKTFAKQILEIAAEKSYCFEKEVNGEKALVICGKVHLFNISMTEFKQRIDRDYERYGERARMAMTNEGIDWKAISHAFRAAYQMEELLLTGAIHFPLKDAAFLKEIKSGAIPWSECEKHLLYKVEQVKKLQDQTKPRPIDHDFIRLLVMSVY